MATYFIYLKLFSVDVIKYSEHEKATGLMTCHFGLYVLNTNSSYFFPLPQNELILSVEAKFWCENMDCHQGDRHIMVLVQK